MGFVFGSLLFPGDVQPFSSHLHLLIHIQAFPIQVLTVCLNHPVIRSPTANAGSQLPVKNKSFRT